MPAGRGPQRLALFVAAILLGFLSLPTQVDADWLSRIARLTEHAGSVGGKGAGRASSALERAAARIKGLPADVKGTALAAHAGPEGHWTFVNRTGERFTAGTPDEMARVAGVLAPDAARTGSGDLTLILTEDTVFARSRHLAELPAGAKLRLAIGNDSFRLVRLDPAATAPLHVEVRPGVLVPATARVMVDETLWQLARPLQKAKVRIIAVSADGPHALRTAPRIDRASGQALSDTIAADGLAGALGAIRGQTAVLTGRIDGRRLHVRLASGAERNLDIDALTRAAADADVALVILNSPAPRQPGARNWLWQRVAVDGLDDALKRATLADFVSALGRGETRYVVSTEVTGTGRVRLKAEPAAQDKTAIPGLSGVISEVVSEVAGKVVTSGIEASLPDAARRRELDARILPGIPSDLQIAYIVCFLLGLVGLGFARSWWKRIWPPEQRTAYAGRLGFEAARATRLALFTMLFIPLVGPVAGPLAIANNALDTIRGLLVIATWPVRALLRAMSRTRG